MMDRVPEVTDPLRLSRKRLIGTAEQISRSYALSNGEWPANYFTINFDHIYDNFIYPNYGISLEEGDDLGYDDDGEKVLGFFDATTNTISLDGALNNRDELIHAKRVFTAWHELGHAILHGDWLRSHPGRFKGGRIITTESALNEQTTDRFERQANLFASHSAAPSWFLDFVLKSTFSLTRPIRFVGPAPYWLDVWGRRKICHPATFHELCRDIAYQVRHRFGGLSVEALTYRVQSSQWTLDVSTTAPAAISPLLRTAPVHVSAMLMTI
jgi:hypothetical protein